MQIKTDRSRRNRRLSYIVLELPGGIIQGLRPEELSDAWGWWMLETTLAAAAGEIAHVPARVSLGDDLGDVSVNGILASHREHSGGGGLPRHEHAAAYLCVVLAGGYAQIADREIDCRRGTLISHPAGHVHANSFGRERTRCVNVYFDASWLEDEALASLFSDYGRVQLDARDEALSRLERELVGGDVGSQLAVVGALLDLVSRVPRETGERTRYSWLSLVCDAIASEPLNPPNLTRLAAEAGVHRAHLCRAFRDATGETIGGYSRRLRLEAAEAMMKGTTNLAEIAAATGFYDQAHFARCFRRHYGQTPGTRRAQLTS